MKLIGEERPIRFFRHHWLWLGKKMFWAAILQLIAAATILYIQEVTIGYAASALFLVSFLYNLYWFVEWRQRKLWITTQRVLLAGGALPFVAESDEVGLEHVQDIDVNRDGIRGLFGCVDYDIQTGHGNLVASWFPRGVNDAIWGAHGPNGGNWGGSKPPKAPMEEEGQSFIRIQGF